MSKKQKVIRWIVSGTLLVAVALVAVSVYRVETSRLDQLETPEENQMAEVPNPTVEEETDDQQQAEQNHATVITGEEEEVPQETPAASDASSSDVTAQMEESQESTSGTAVAETEAPVLPALDFTEDSLMEWPVSGEVLLDYSMDHTVYFPTLNVYKYNPAILVGANTGDPVFAAANGKIISVEESAETGTTVTTDLGNGYQAIYGQLKDVQVAAEDVISAGTVLGSVNDPSRFYSTEGTNLFFSMTKDGESVDPVVYLP